MDSESLRTDPIGALLEMKGDSAEIIPDQINGYDRVVPQPQLLEQMAAMYADAILSTDQDYQPQWAALLKHERAYEGESDGDETITIPFCKRITNQQTAFLTNSILSKSPIVAVKPLDGGTYEIPDAVLDESDPMAPVVSTSQITAEDAANLYQTYLQYKLTQRIDFEQLVEDTVFAIHIGENPTWWKIPYDPRVRYAKRRQMLPVTDASGRKGKRLEGIENFQVADGEAVEIFHLSNMMVTMPVDENDEQKSSWLAEKRPLSSSDIWEGIKTRRFDFCLPDGEKPDDTMIRNVLGLAEDMQQDDFAQQIAQIDRRVAGQAQLRHDVREVWFFHPVKRTTKRFLEPEIDPATGQPGEPKEVSEETFEIRSLCGTLHLKARVFLNLYVNPYWHGKRPYMPFFMRKKPHRFVGSSSVGDIAPIQKLVSQIFHLQIQNQVQQNIKLFLIRNNSATWRWFEKRNGVVAPGDRVPFDDENDVSPVQLGSPVASMANEITFLGGEADRLAVERDYTDIPGRTPAATMAQFESLAKMQPQAILRGIRRRISKALVMYLQTVAQFNAYETIPFLDPDTNKTMRKLIGFPRETIENNFSLTVTATGDDDTPQARIEKTSILLKETDAQNEASLKFGMLVLDPRQPPQSRELSLFLWIRREQLYSDLMQVFRPDWSKFTLTEKRLREMMKQADAQLMAMQQQGAEDGDVSTPDGGGAVPQLPAGPPGLGQPGAEPGGEGIPQPDAQGNPFA